MKRIIFAALLTAFTIPSFAQVGVSVSIGQPGFYGQIDIGDALRPEVIYSQPVIVEHEVVEGRPLYLHVPPGYAKHWHKHCHEYKACGRPVYFVRDDWYNNHYVPYYREHHGERHEHDDDQDRDHGHGHDKGHGHDHDD